MSINDVILCLMAVFAAVGAADRILGNRWGLGEKFEEGILAIGPLALSMWGAICIAPVLADVLYPVVAPVFRVLGADPGMFPGCILACDMGGAPLAAAIAQDVNAGLFGGVMIGSTLGGTIVFTIPVALNMIAPEDRPFLARGILAGIITVPVGGFVGGLLARWPLAMVCRNLVPIVLFAAAVALGLWRAEQQMIRGFIVFGKGVQIVITVGLAAAIVETLTGLTLIPGLAPLSEGFVIVGNIAIVLAGAFPLIHMVTCVFRKPLLAVGRVLGVGETAAAGLVATLANSIPVFGMVKEMDKRGKVLNMAFAVSAAFVFGDHLGFTAGYAPQLLFPVIMAKLVGGVTAVVLAWFMTRGRKHASDLT